MDLIKSSVNNWIKLISLVLSLLVFSFGEIALNDISTLFEEPDYNDILENLKTGDEKNSIKTLEESIAEVDKNISREENLLYGIEEQIESSRETLDQLLESQKVSPDTGTEKLKNEYQNTFIELQGKREKSRAALSDLKLNYSQLSSRLDSLQSSVNRKYEEKAEKIHSGEIKKYETKILISQIIFLVILGSAAVILYLKFKSTKYIYPVSGYSSAIALMIAQAIYIHSPFKLHYYVFIFIGILFCIALIIWLVKNLTKINKKETLSVIKKNLIAKRCPGCSSVISINDDQLKTEGGGKLKSFVIVLILLGALFGNGSGIVIFFDNFGDISPSEIIFSVFLIIFPWIVLYLFVSLFSTFTDRKVPDPEHFNSNSCPVCGLKLIEICEKCGEKRHSLLPYCGSCGNSKEIYD